MLLSGLTIFCFSTLPYLLCICVIQGANDQPPKKQGKETEWKQPERLKDKYI